MGWITSIADPIFNTQPSSNLGWSGLGDAEASFPQGITLEATCTGNGTVNQLACSSAMTVTAGDTITCNVTGVQGGNNLTGAVMDIVNGFYDNVFGIVHPANSLSWVTTAVFQNSAGGSITPTLFYSSAPNIRGTISCYAWKGAATSNVLDGGAVAQTQSATATNPTSGTATAPTNNNEAVVAFMSRNSSTAPSSGGGNWLPVGTLSLVGTSNVRQASEYQIQGTASSVGGEFTGNGGSIAFVDSQIAILPSGTTGGYRALTGIFAPLGAPGSAPTGTVSAATMGGATSTLASTHLFDASPFWSLNGATAPTYDTSINPTGTKRIMVQQSAHTFGDAGSSVKYAGSTAANNYLQIKDIWGSQGTPVYLNSFYRMSSVGSTNSTVCDIMALSGGITDGTITVQAQYSSGGTFTFDLEPSENGSSQQSATHSVDTDYFLQLHVAGVNERYHQLLIYTKSGGVWSLNDTLNYDHLCTNGNNANCTTPAAVVAPTGTASSGSTALTISSGTSTANGQLVLDNVNNCIPWPTLVEAGGGTTSITLSQNTTCSISSTAVSFYTVPANLTVATNGSVTAGSTALTVVAPGVGTIAVGQAIGGSGIASGTTVAAVSGTSVTLSLPATATMTNGGVSFWGPNNNLYTALFGKFSSCNVSSDQWWSGFMVDTLGAWGAFAPN